MDEYQKIVMNHYINNLNKVIMLLKATFQKSKHILLYSALMAILVFALKWLQWKYLVTDNSLDIYIGLLAIFFTLMGVWIARQLSKSKVQTLVVEKKVYVDPSENFELNEPELKKLNLTSREYEVLQFLTKGCSNAEIGERLYLSTSTVKKHVSTLFVKMDVKSRIQALEKARRLGIAPP